MRWGVALGGSFAFTAILALAWLAPFAAPAAASPPPAARPSFTAAPRASTEPSDPPRRPRIGPFAIPVAGAELPSEAALLPEAARDHRAGVHEGVDIVAEEGTPVLAMAAGRVIRLDHDFVEWSAEERASAFLAAHALGYTPSYTLDRTRGRQVWIDHGGGVVTRYAHLSSVAALPPGAYVAPGTEIGAVGSSGYPAGGPHLHFEIRVGDSYLGEGLTAAQLAHALRRALRGRPSVEGP
ncbi:MAG TPA: M23 family metallopeptidase [Candidatus Limnocylindria bacterium]|nr:M23 family metallopeptidase [Candidatus Limnocylindria bacterium]